jgi:hypothetical protein
LRDARDLPLILIPTRTLPHPFADYRSPLELAGCNADQSPEEYYGRTRDPSTGAFVEFLALAEIGVVLRKSMQYAMSAFFDRQSLSASVMMVGFATEPGLPLLISIDFDMALDIQASFEVKQVRLLEGDSLTKVKVSAQAQTCAHGLRTDPDVCSASLLRKSARSRSFVAAGVLDRWHYRGGAPGS